MTVVRFEVDKWDFTGALCREIDDAAFYFFPEKGVGAATAKKICAMCEVRPTCLEYAIRNTSISHGIWGGLSAREIQRIRATLGITAPVGEEEEDEYGEAVC